MDFRRCSIPEYKRISRAGKTASITSRASFLLIESNLKNFISQPMNNALKVNILRIVDFLTINVPVLLEDNSYPFYILT